MKAAQVNTNKHHVIREFYEVKHIKMTEDITAKVNKDYTTT